MLKSHISERLLDRGEFRISQNVLSKYGEKYIFQKLISKIDAEKIEHSIQYFERDGLEVISKWFGYNENDLRMYGSAAELTNELRIFRDCDRNEKFFGTNSWEPFNKTVVATLSEKKVRYMSKYDALIHVQRLLVWKNMEKDSAVMHILLILLFKSKEKELENCCNEFIPVKEFYNSSVCALFTAIIDRIELGYVFPDTNENQLMFVDYSFEEYYNQFKKLFPTNIEKKDLKLFENILKFEWSLLPKGHIIFLRQLCQSLFSNCHGFITGVQHIFTLGPQFFLPWSKTPNNPFRQTIRVFVDKDERFMMTNEVEKLLKVNLETDGNETFVSAIPEKTIKEKYKNQIDLLEIMQDPIRRAKHHAVPIMGIDGNHYYLAVDAFFSIFRHLIFGFKLFQRVKQNDASDVDRFFNSISHYFAERKTSMYFLNVNVIEKVKVLCETSFAHRLKVPVKFVRNAKSDGFTVDNLKNELKNLGLTDFFPRIADYAQMSYEQVVKDKRGSFLRTCDLFDAIEYCQFICVINRFSFIRKFLHQQGVCGRILYTGCSICDPSLVLDTCEKCPELREKYEKAEKNWNTLEDAQKNLENKMKVMELKNNEIKKEQKTYKEEMKVQMEQMKKETEQWKVEKEKQTRELNKKNAILLEKAEKAQSQLEKQKKQFEKEKKVLTEKCASLQNELKKERSEFASEKTLMSKQIEKFQNDLKKEKQNVVHLEKLNNELIEKQQNSEIVSLRYFEELTEKTRLLEEANTSQTRLQIENESKNAHIQHLIDKLIAVSATQREQQTRSETPKLSEEMKNKLFELQTTRNLLLNENSAQHVALHTHRLYTMSDDPHIRQGAKYELQQFNLKYQEFMMTLEKNIEIIQKNVYTVPGDLMEINEFPDFPDGFMTSYERVMKKEFGNEESEERKEDVQEHLSSEGHADELADKECLVCLGSMESNHSTIKCQHCKRRYHCNCAKKWLKQKKTCPACSRTLLDPQEYPSLS